MACLPAGSDLLSTSQIQLPRISLNCITSKVQASDLQIQGIIDATNKDDTLVLLRHTVNNGWPMSVKEVPEEIQLYWNLREQITIENGMLLKNTRTIILQALQLELVQKIHKGCLGLVNCLYQA